LQRKSNVEKLNKTSQTLKTQLWRHNLFPHNAVNALMDELDQLKMAAFVSHVVLITHHLEFYEHPKFPWQQKTHVNHVLVFNVPLRYDKYIVLVKSPFSQLDLILKSFIQASRCFLQISKIQSNFWDMGDQSRWPQQVPYGRRKLELRISWNH